jgi:hypothetical protein
MSFVLIASATAATITAGGSPVKVGGRSFTLNDEGVLLEG